MDHRRDQTPLVDGRLVALSRVLAHVAVETAHRVDVAAQDCHTDVAATCVHGRHFAPAALDRMVAATRVEVVHSVETADDVNLIVDRRAAVVRARPHVRALQLHPAICARVVRLDHVSGTPSAPAADREYHLKDREIRQIKQ